MARPLPLDRSFPGAPGRAGRAGAGPGAPDERQVRALRTIGAIGWATRALVYLLLAGIVVKIAVTGGAEPQLASKTGVLATLLDKPLGVLLVAAIGLGAVTYAAARLAPLALDPTQATVVQWLRSGGTAAIYLFLAFGCWRIIREQRRNELGEDALAQQVTGTLLETWWGTIGVTAAALGLVGYGLWQFRRAVSCHFLRRIDDERSPVDAAWVRRVGAAGFASRGVIAITAGAFAGIAVARKDPAEVHLLDGSFRAVLRAPAGLAIVLLLAAGLASFAVYCALSATARDHENG